MDILKSLALGGIGNTFVAFLVTIIAAIARKKKFIRLLLISVGILCVIAGNVLLFIKLHLVYNSTLKADLQ